VFDDNALPLVLIGAGYAGIDFGDRHWVDETFTACKRCCGSQQSRRIPPTGKPDEARTVNQAWSEDIVEARPGIVSTIG
jgi:hypothetical protein